MPADQAAPVPTGYNGLALASAGFLAALFGVIGLFVAKLWYDERQARRRREALMAMTGGDDENQEEAPRNRGARRRHVQMIDDDFDPDAAESEDQYDDEAVLAGGEKVGKKKLAKLQAKAQAKAQREAEQAEREEKKKKEEERRARDEEERQLREAEEQAEKDRLRAEKEERERKEHEEYLKLKETFSLQEEGYDQLDEDESENLMRTFIEYVQKTKVVNIEELASRFRLRPEEVVEKLHYFVDNELLTGVIDDRGKFIYVSPEELQAVAKFINQRGRVSLEELAEYSNRLVSLEPCT